MKPYVQMLGLFLLLGTACLRGQEHDISISGSFRDVPFPEFVKLVEEQKQLRFFYREEWIRGIRITASGEDLSLTEVLDRVLRPAGIHFLLDDRDIYLSKKRVLVADLPDYSGMGILEDLPSGTETRTEAEQRYIDGRKAGILETLVIGDRERGEGQHNAVIHGKISDLETGDPLIGATIYFEELKKGSATDVDGRFTIVVKPGKYTVEFKCMGMEDLHHYLEVLSGGDLDIRMEKTVIALTEVVVQANRYHNVRGTQMGFDRLNYKILKEVPVVMGEKDVLKVIQMLPGVQTVGEGAAGFNVRGSAADQNMIYVNKVPVYNSSHLFGFFTSFSPDIVKDFTLYKSNLPASYGGRLASFFDITARQGNLNKYTARGGISPITGRLSLEGPVVKGKSSLILAGRSTYSDWILNRLENLELRESRASFQDLSGVLTWEADERTLIKAFAYYSADRFNLGSSNRYAYDNSGGSLDIRRRMGSRLTGDLALVYGTYGFSTTDMQEASMAWTQDYRIRHYELKVDFSWLSLGKHKLTFGANSILYDLDRGMVLPYGELSMRAPVDLGQDRGMENALYLADEISLAPWLTLYGGLRFASFMAMGPDQVNIYGESLPYQPGNLVESRDFSPFEVYRSYTSLEPRAALNLMMSPNSSLKLSYNRVSQFLFMLSNTVAISPTDQWKLCDYNIRPPQVDQLSFGVYKDFPRGGVNTSMEVYYKKMNDVVDYRDGAIFTSTADVETLTLQGEQEAYGFEAMIRKSAGKISGWVAYSWSRSLLQFASDIPGEQINFGQVYPSNYDRPHNLSLVTNLKLNRRLSLSSNIVYTTGRPVTYPVSIYYVDGMEFIDYSERNAYRIPDYFRLDLSINLEGNLKERKFMHSYWMLNLYNVTGRRNAYSVYFQNDDGVINGYQLSIFGQMFVTLSWNFKLGNYASE